MPRSSRLDAGRFCEIRPIPGSRENSETRLSPAERDHGRQTPGVPHHVMGQGIERKRIFIEKRDRQDFITRLAALAFENVMHVLHERP